MIYKFQNGTNNKDKIEYYKTYIASPKFKERLYNANAAEYPTLNQGVITKLTNDDIQRYDNAISTVNIFPIDPTDKVNIHKFIDGIPGAYSPMAHTVFHKKSDKPIMDEVIVHELSHSSSLGDKLIPPYSQRTAPDLLNQQKGSYYGTPTEIKARVDALRYYAKKKGIYDAGTEDFTQKHLDKILADPDFKKFYFMKDIREKYLKNPKNFIKVMNTLASGDQTIEVLKAQEGAILAPKTPSVATFDDEEEIPKIKQPVSKTNEIKFETFSHAFNQARLSGKKTFTWINPKTGKSGVFGTQLATEVISPQVKTVVKTPVFSSQKKSVITNGIPQEIVQSFSPKQVAQQVTQLIPYNVPSNTVLKSVSKSVSKPLSSSSKTSSNSKPKSEPKILNTSPLAAIIQLAPPITPITPATPAKPTITSTPTKTKPAIAAVGERQVQIPYDVIQQQEKWTSDPKWKDYKGDKYYIFSKQSGRMYIFNKDHSLKFEGPWLRGKDPGDVNTRKANVTPAGTGVFAKKTITKDYPLGYNRLLFNTKTTKVDATIPEAKTQKLISTGQAMHFLYNDPTKPREKIFANDQIPDKLMSNGCINVGGEVICNPDFEPNYAIDSFAITREAQRPLITQDNYTLMSADQRAQIAKLLYSYEGRPGKLQALKYKLPDK